ncbi:MULTISPECIES: YacC family pilotin-like protein [Tatumella]|uniref:YacC family pilotin-like protein n=1 Tax=Tatumella punctata TaxID=399969 RepID=A0ABW1VRF6_9GAMM|nr:MULTISPECIES: YacC family pilotin-like protein [unclassified Tatumella]MBS0856126.1 YacC family pilotin-like protein [Tatumella sp. JGM16]MBS0877462.1 YacC family pilotin-like protein [Tatumella sp. JGM82]MBS0890996.1 YacC family pilotin-like protein [Tatumella sp. JGM94]MBS0894187.1 YacC family pilotin-like protein [Tatumella sp. JGM130]MBS0902010.1 YacC family pilotin-like protein [Tatumella sp. JGM100]
MSKIIRFLLLSALLGASGTSFALDESQAEDMADLTAVFIYLKNDCGYQDIPDTQIRNALIFFARQNHWDLSNYDLMNMQQRGESSYQDLSGIAVPTAKKCRSLADKSLSLLAYVNR